ncbi:MAG: exosome protein [Nitrosopumilus sp.]|jgi:RNA binding exosome subunit|nr:exosome protein [Nitrosopumilus sp.]
MDEKLEVTIDIIVHATEDISKIFQAFEETFGLNGEEFSIKYTTGHYDNPITILNAKLVKKRAMKFIEKFLKCLSKEQLDQMTDEIEERTVDSRYHIRMDKQELINGKIVFKEKNSIRLKIHTPIYNKKEIVKTFRKIFEIVN